MWYVYIIKCSDNTFYTGTTSEISRRLDEHNSRKGGAYTRTRAPVKLVYQETRKTRSQAQKREAQIKSWPRSKKCELIRKSRRIHL